MDEKQSHQRPGRSIGQKHSAGGIFPITGSILPSDPGPEERQQEFDGSEQSQNWEEVH
jgi:hypothetical protein